MTIKQFLLSGSIVVASAFVSVPLHASSVLIQRMDGGVFAEVLPPDACQMEFEEHLDSGNVTRAFPMADGTIAESQHGPGQFGAGESWSITTAAGLQTPRSKGWGWAPVPQFYKAAPGSEWSRVEPSRYVISEYKTLLVREGTERQCTAFMNREGNTFLGYRLSTVSRLTFFTSDAGAIKAAGQLAKAVEQKNKIELARVEAWRKKVTLGSETHCGMVVDAKAPLIKVQTSIGEKWFQTAQLYPVGEKQCMFKQGQYQE